jgi:hypothetical protein
MRKGARQKAQKGGQDDVQLFSFLRSAGKESFFRSLAEKPNFSIKALSSRARPHRGKKKSRNRESSAVLKARKTRKKSFFYFLEFSSFAYANSSHSSSIHVLVFVIFMLRLSLCSSLEPSDLFCSRSQLSHPVKTLN